MNKWLRWSRPAYWLTFAAVQITGMILPYFANVHSNIFPALLGDALLLPGIVIGFAFHLSDAPAFVVAVILNAVVSYFGMRLLRLAPFTLRDEPHWDDDVKGRISSH